MYGVPTPKPNMVLLVVVLCSVRMSPQLISQKVKDNDAAAKDGYRGIHVGRTFTRPGHFQGLVRMISLSMGVRSVQKVVVC